jgi:predicted aldo/keto reductase-like oxidoreductase
LGFSFHDKYPVFQEIIDAYNGWAFCQIQYNYMDIENQAGTRGLQYAASKGLAVVIMEPLLGGRLVNPPQQIQDLWDTFPTKRSPAEWALQWVWNQPEVSVVLSGMSAMEQVQENLVSADRSGAGSFTPQELELVGQVREQYGQLCPIPCTKCQYCMPCPNGVDIPRNFDLFNTAVMYNVVEKMRGAYTRLAEEKRASACIQCQECESKCPQSIPISEWMPVVHQVLGDGQSLEACTMP